MRAISFSHQHIVISPLPYGLHGLSSNPPSFSSHFRVSCCCMDFLGPFVTVLFRTKTLIGPQLYQCISGPALSQHCAPPVPHTSQQRSFPPCSQIPFLCHHLRWQFQHRPRLTSSATTQAQRQCFELTQPNIFPNYGLLQLVKGVGLRNHKPRSS